MIDKKYRCSQLFNKNEVNEYFYNLIEVEIDIFVNPLSSYLLTLSRFERQTLYKNYEHRWFQSIGILDVL